MDNIESKIQFFKDTHKPGTSFYFDECGDIRKGPMKFPRCMLCNKNLEILRKNNPRRRFIKFCSTNCRKEHNRRQKIREKLGSDGLFWNTKNDEMHLSRHEMKATYIRKGQNPREILFKARKSKWV